MPLWFLRILCWAKSGMDQHLPRRWLDVDAFHVSTRALTRDVEETDQRWTVRWATREDANAFHEIDDTVSEVVRNQLDHGFSVALVEEAGSIIAYKVMTTRCRRQKIFEFGLPDDSVFHVYIWVSPNWRSRDLVNVMHRFTSQRWRSHGYLQSVNTGDTLKRLVAVKRKRRSHNLHEIAYIRVWDYTAIRIDRSWHFGRWSESNPFRIDLAQSTQSITGVGVEGEA